SSFAWASMRISPVSRSCTTTVTSPCASYARSAEFMRREVARGPGSAQACSLLKNTGASVIQTASASRVDRSIGLLTSGPDRRDVPQMTSRKNAWLVALALGIATLAAPPAARADHRIDQPFTGTRPLQLEFHGGLAWYGFGFAGGA